MIRVAILEDNRLVRDVLASMLATQPDIAVVLSSRDFSAGALRTAAPHVVLLDIGLEEADAVEVARSIREHAASAQVVVMDLLPVHEEISQLVQAGVVGFILKDATFDDFVTTVRRVARGERVLPSSMTGTLFSQIADVIAANADDARDAVHMTPRERDVIALIADGMSNKEIGLKLNIASDTVKSHVRNVMEKLALRTRLQIAMYVRDRSA